METYNRLLWIHIFIRTWGKWGGMFLGIICHQTLKYAWWLKCNWSDSPRPPSTFGCIHPMKSKSWRSTSKPLDQKRWFLPVLFSDFNPLSKIPTIFSLRIFILCRNLDPEYESKPQSLRWELGPRPRVLSFCLSREPPPKPHLHSLPGEAEESICLASCITHPCKEGPEGCRTQCGTSEQGGVALEDVSLPVDLVIHNQPGLRDTKAPWDQPGGQEKWDCPPSGRQVGESSSSITFTQNPAQDTQPGSPTLHVPSHLE